MGAGFGVRRILPGESNRASKGIVGECASAELKCLTGTSFSHRMKSA